MARALGALAVVCASSCASPTLPLPPPAQPTVTITGPNTVHLSSVHGAEPGALVIIVNKNPTIPNDKRVFGSQADESGSWDADVTASRGDVLELTEEFGTTRSPPLDFQVQ